MKVSLSRPCPLCLRDKPKTLMRFTPEQITQANPAFKPDVYKKAVTGQEDCMTYSRCQDCGMVYCEHLWSPDILRAVYEDAIDHEKSREYTLSIHKRIWLVDLWGILMRLLSIRGFEHLGQLKLIDYGSGWGDFLEVVQGYGVEGIGYDEDRMKTEFASKRGIRIAATMDELSSFGPVDIFVMNSVLEHLQDPSSMLKFAWDNLRSGGYLMFGVMDYRRKFLRKNMKVVRMGLQALTRNLDPLQHVNIYNYRTARLSAEKTGFRFLGTETVFRWSQHPWIRFGKPFVWLFNEIEKLSSFVFADGDRPITLFFRKPT